MTLTFQLSIDEPTSEFVSRQSVIEGFTCPEQYVLNVLDQVRQREELSQALLKGMESPRLKLTPELEQNMWDQAVAKSERIRSGS